MLALARTGVKAGGKDVGLVVPIEGERSPDSSSIELLKRLVAEDLTAVNGVIVARMDSRVALIPELAGYIVAAGGKRIRPMLTIAGAKICGYAGDRHVELAACVEFIHTATLLHDDVVDESELRRGNAAAHAVWGNPASVLVGDFLFSRAFQLMVEDGSLRVLDILSRASAVIAEGEVWQLATTNNPETSEDSYLEVITAKTAALFAAACRIGAVLAERPRPEEEALESYGRNLGIAFQLVDDALDYSARQASFGKTVGDDFREGKMTLHDPAGLPPRERRGARVLAPHPRAGRAGRRRLRKSVRHAGTPRRAPRHRRAGAPLRRHRPRRARHLRRRRAQARDDGSRGLLHRTRTLSASRPIARPRRWRYKDAPASNGV